MIYEKNPISISNTDRINIRNLNMYINSCNGYANGYVTYLNNIENFKIDNVFIMESNGESVYIALYKNWVDDEYYPLSFDDEYYPLFFTNEDENLKWIFPDKLLHAETKEKAVQLFDTIVRCCQIDINENIDTMNTAYHYICNYLLNGVAWNSKWTCEIPSLKKSPFTEIEEKPKPISPFTCFNSTEEYLTSVWRKVSL